MPEKSTPSEPTEKTPKGLTVPVPSRDRFFANLKKVAKVRKPPASERPKK
jgi:hypothetical protein